MKNTTFCYECLDHLEDLSEELLNFYLALCHEQAITQTDFIFSEKYEENIDWMVWMLETEGFVVSSCHPLSKDHVIVKATSFHDELLNHMKFCRNPSWHLGDELIDICDEEFY